MSEKTLTPLCVAEGVSLVPWGPLGGGFLSGKYKAGERPTANDGRIGSTPDDWEESWQRRATEANWRTLAAVERVAEAHSGATPAQVSLAWLLARPAVASVVTGARTPQQLASNLEAAALTLTAEELATLDTVSKPAATYPARAVNTVSR